MKIFLAVLLLVSSAFAADLQKNLDSLAADYHGKVALFAKDLKTGQTVAIDADEPVQTASVIKLPIMIEAFYLVKEGKLKLDQKITLTKDNQVPGSGVLQFMDSGLQLTLKDAITLMIILSDNTATNLVIDTVGIPNVNQRIAAMGLKNTYLYKKVFKPADGPMPADQKKFGLGKTTAREMAEAMESVYRCDLGDKDLCKTMLDILQHQQDRDSVPRYLESGDTSEKPSAIANKTGSLDDVRNDVALVETKSAPIVISAFTWDNQDQRWMPENAAQVLIANMARDVVSTWAPAGVKGPAAAKQ